MHAITRHYAMVLITAAGIALALATHLANGETLRVPGQYPTIQAGIDAAQNLDTVLVADGVYTGPGNKDLDFGGKLITVRSENGPDNCTIDCQGSEVDPHRGFYFRRGETSTGVVRGFTVLNGFVASSAPGGPWEEGFIAIIAARHLLVARSGETRVRGGEEPFSAVGSTPPG